MDLRKRRKLLVASVGVATITYAIAQTACSDGKASLSDDDGGIDATPPTSGNLPAPPDDGSVPTSGNLAAPPPIDASADQDAGLAPDADAGVSPEADAGSTPDADAGSTPDADAGHDGSAEP